MKDISKLRTGQKVKVICTDDFKIKGTVDYIEEDEEYDYEWVVHLDLEDKPYGFFIKQSEIKEIIILDEKE